MLNISINSIIYIKGGHGYSVFDVFFEIKLIFRGLFN